MAKSAEKLSSGYRINRAGDDAAGLAISEKMRSQIRGLTMAAKNSQDAISLVQTAEGALQETHSMLQRMNELAVQAATGTNEDIDRNALAKEFEQLKREINDVAEQTTFNNMKILDGSLSNSTGYVRSAATAGVTVTSSSVDGTSAMAVSNDVTKESTGPQRGTFTVTVSNGAVVGNGTTPTMTIADQSGAQNVTGVAQAGAPLTDENDIAALFEGAKVTLDGVAYTATVDGAVITFKADADPDATTGDYTPAPGAVAGTLAGNVTAAAGDDGKVSAATPAKNELQLDADKLKVGDVLTVNGQTIEVVADAAAAGASTADDTFVLGTDTTEDLADKVVTLLGTTDFNVDATGKAAGTLIIEQKTAGTGDVKIGFESSSDGKNYKNTIEIDAAKLKEGDVIKGTVGDAGSFEVEITKDLLDSTKNETASEKIAKEIAAQLTGVTQKGNAITYTGSKVTETDLDLESITDTDADSYKTNAMRIQVGALEDEQLSISIDAMNTKGLGLDGHNLDSQNEAGMAITAVRAAINLVSDQRATLGAMQNRLEHKIANLNVSTENLSAAESRIRDVDMASEMTNFTKNNILSQAATAMLAQANALPQNVLSLLG